MKFRCLRHFCVGIPLAVHGPTADRIGPKGSKWMWQSWVQLMKLLPPIVLVTAAQGMGLFMDYLCHSKYIKGKSASWSLRLMSHWATSPHWWKGQWSWKHWPGQCYCSCFHLISWNTKNNLPEQHGAHHCTSKQPQSLSCFMAETVTLLISQPL